MTVKCRPYYLPREFTAVFITIVYIAPGANANANEALQELHETISSLQIKHPEAFYVVAGDFNHVKLTDTLSSFYQHVTFPTRGDNTLDCVYTNIHGAYRALPRPPLGLSDHISILLAPAYRPLLGRIRPTKRLSLCVTPLKHTLTQVVSVLLVYLAFSSQIHRKTSGINNDIIEQIESLLVVIMFA